MFNAITYFKNKSNTLKLTKGIYTFCRVTGINQLEDVLDKTKSASNFLAVNDIDDGVTVRIGGGYFHRRAIVVFILKKYNIKDLEERETKMAETRLIRDKLVARLLKDSDDVPELYYLDRTRIPYKEVPGYFANGVCGIYFIITIQEPVSLIDNADDWD